MVNTDAGRFGHAAKSGSAESGSARPGSPLTIGLVNNMAGAAFQATERQFVSLLNSASDGIPFQLSFYTLPGLSRSESGGERFTSHYGTINTLLSTQLDGIIVTGREPKMTDLREEPYWRSFIELLEWARENTFSSVWSCLAAHAAVLHMDGIGRRRSDEKNFGIFACTHRSEHPLTDGLPARFHMPHSRWNGIAQEDLENAGYRALSLIEGGGVDAFIKQEKSFLVFFQGHPEYETETLMREYRRDVGRYLRGEAATYPLPPRGYFSPSTEEALALARGEAPLYRSKAEALHQVSRALENARIENTWQQSAIRIYRNWLEGLWAQKIAGASRTMADVSLAR